MKTSKFIPIVAASFIVTGFSVSIQAQPAGRGMPADARANIHTLFNQHEQIVRNLTLTDKGYIATTTSTNPVVAAALKQHVTQMGDRLKSGLMVRRWDPAFAEYAAHYQEIDHRFEPMENGIRAVVTGKNPEAIKVAQNHAKVIVDFAEHGWTAHDRSHPAALPKSADNDAVVRPMAATCCLKDAAPASGGMQQCGANCCRRNTAN